MNMRKGQNPAKFVKDVARPERITVALLNYIPFLSGFYSETLDVLKVCMESMRRDAGLPFDLMVFDNGAARVKAAQELVKWLSQPAQDARWDIEAGSLPLRRSTVIDSGMTRMRR